LLSNKKAKDMALWARELWQFVIQHIKSTISLLHLQIFWLIKEHLIEKLFK